MLGGRDVRRVMVGSPDASAAESTRPRAQIKTLKESNSSSTDTSAMAAQIQSEVFQSITTHMTDYADEDEQALSYLLSYT